MMSNWPLQEEEYRGYKIVRKMEEIFGDIFALFLRMHYYEARKMKNKAYKIQRSLSKKVPGSVNFLEQSFQKTKRVKNKTSEKYPVTQQDFERLEKVFGRNLL